MEIASSQTKNDEQTEETIQSEENTTDESTDISTQESSLEGTTNGMMLVVYFSHTGNTETISNMIANYTGADLFKAETVTPYPEDYNECVDVAKEEQDNNARPELSAHVDDMSQYDVIFKKKFSFYIVFSTCQETFEFIIIFQYSKSSFYLERPVYTEKDPLFRYNIFIRLLTFFYKVFRHIGSGMVYIVHMMRIHWISSSVR